MKLLLLVLLGLQVHQSRAQDFTFGFGQKEYCAVEGEDYQYCIVVVSGVAPEGFMITVYNTIGDTIISDSIQIPNGFAANQPPICVSRTADDNDCLDSGSTIDLEIKTDGLPDGVSIAAGCDESHVRVFDDEVIEYDVSQDVMTVPEGTTSVSVCITLSCVDGPTKRCAPVLFHVDPVEGLAELQKKIAVIPTGIDNDGMVCCDIQLQGGFDVPEDSFVDVPYSVKSEDLNVKGNAEGIIRVQDGGGCPDPFFENNTPMVTGDDVTIDLSDCVTEATCTFAGSTVDCGNTATNSLTLSTGRNTRILLVVNVIAPFPRIFSRRIRMDMATDQCDSHLVDEGITKAIEDIANAYTLEFEGTGPNQGDPITEFLCEVFDMSGTLVAQTPCSPPTYTFILPGPEDTTEFYVVVTPDPDEQGITCRIAHTRTYHYPVPLLES